jgi:CheY-like chemotaxis protein
VTVFPSYAIVPTAWLVGAAVPSQLPLVAGTFVAGALCAVCLVMAFRPRRRSKGHRSRRTRTRARRPTPEAQALGVGTLAGLRVVAAVKPHSDLALPLEALRRAGCDLKVVHSGHDAFAARRDGPELDALLLARDLPDADGCEVAEMIREYEAAAGGARVPIIALAKTSYPDELQRIIDAGMDDCLTAPITMRELTVALDSWRSLSQIPARPVSIAHDMPDLIDLSVVGQLRSLSGRKPDFFSELVENYARDGNQRLNEIEAARQSTDAARLAELAHALKGSSKTVGAAKFAAVLEALEAQANEGEVSAYPSAGQLKTEFARACRALAETAGQRSSGKPKERADIA